MKDVFVEVSDDVMTRAADSSASSSAMPPASSPIDPNIDGHICPFCGLTREITEDFDPSTPCPRCTLADTPTTRNATKARIGPWHVRQVRNPWAPGMRFETLLALVKRGQVTKDSMVRGPTTHQLWKRASEIKGLSREFGLCHSCGGEIEKTAGICPHCNRLQEPPINPDVLVEGREMLAAREAPPGKPAPAALPPRQTAPVPRPVPLPAPIPSFQEFDEPPSIDIGATAPPPSDDLLSADVGELSRVVSEDEAAALARQITARPPARTRPLRQVTPGADDALLTPQELAQAFQLDFSPAGQARRRGSKTAIVVVLLLLVAGGVAALLYLRPDLRTSVVAWTNEKWGAMFSSHSSRDALPTMPPRVTIEPIAPDEAPATRPRPAPIIIAPPPAPVMKEVEVADDPVEPVAKEVEAPTSAPVAPPIAIPPPPSTAEVDSPTVASAKLPESPPPTLIIPKAPPPPAVKKVQMPEGTPEEQAGSLWRRAIDAEANQDYVEAVQCYELIRTLPHDVQPWGLDVRLDLARKLAK